MAYIREIITEGHPTLRKVAKKVDPSEIADPIFQQLLDDMFETMYDAPGIGLAAPQIGVSKRIFTVDLQDDADGHGPFVVINPKFTVTEGEVESVEGCLSVPGMVGDLTRFERVVCTGLDRRGKKITLEGTGLFGRCLQHEMDHLNGVLYIDKAKNIRAGRDRRGSGGGRRGRRRRSLKLLVFGTSEFAVPVLEAVAERHDVVGVVTQPDRPAGRGHKLVATPVKRAAEALGLRVLTPEKLKPFVEEARALGADAFVVASYGKIVPQALLDLVPIAFNVHPSMLPLYRGATPLQSAIRDGRSETGVTIIAMDAGMDTGDVLLQERAPIGPSETYGELHDRLAKRGAEMAVEALERHENGTLAAHAAERGRARAGRVRRRDRAHPDSAADERGL